PIIGDERMGRLRDVAAAARKRFAGRTVWNVNSTATGGGVAEMLAVLAGYVKGAGLDSRWLVIDGDAPFFAITKRVHNRLHGSQAAGLVEPLRARGATVVWRCHVGSDTANDSATSAWSFLEPFLHEAQALVFSRRQYAPPWVPDDCLVVIPPSIDPLSPKNE